MHLIKVFNGYCFIGKGVDVTVVVGNQKRPIRAVQTRVVAGLLSL